MGNYPSEYYGATCYKCQAKLPPCYYWEDLKQEHIDRLVTSGVMHVFHGGLYYRPVEEEGHHMCPSCFWAPRKREEERRENERREYEKRERERMEEQRKAEEERLRLKREQEKRARLEEIRKENERVENEKRRIEEIRLREEEQKKCREEEAEREQERREQLQTDLERQEREQKLQELQAQREEEERSEWNSEFQKTTKLRGSLNESIRKSNSKQLHHEVLKESYREESTIGKIEIDPTLTFIRKGMSTKILQMRISKLDELDQLNDKELIQKLLGALASDIFSNDTDSLITFVSLLLQRYIQITCENPVGGIALRDCLTNIVTSIPDHEMKYFTDALCVLSLDIQETEKPDDPEVYSDIVQTFLHSLIVQGNIKQQHSTWVSRCIYLTAERIVGAFSAMICTDLVQNDIWSYDELQRCLKKISNFHSALEIDNIFAQIKMHRISADYFLNIADNSQQSWQAFNTNLKKTINDEPERSFDSLFEEIGSSKMIPDEHLGLVIKVVKLTIEKLESVGLHVGLNCTSLDYKKLIAKKDNIKVALRKIGSQEMNFNLIADALAMVCSAVYQYHNYCPRLTQILTCALLTISSQHRTNRLMEINTGEGKSCIIAMFTAILGMQGKNVDILTSSPLLARRDAAEWKKFYSIFDLTSTNNTDEPTTSDNEDERSKKIYENSIVYGTVSSFAADILRDEFQMKDIRRTRGFQTVIVDEVDLMMLDHGVQLTYLSHRAAGMRHIEPVIAAIWVTVSQYSSLSTNEGDCMYCGTPKFFIDAIFNSIDSDVCDIESPIQLLKIAEDEQLVEPGLCQNLQDSNAEKKKEMIKRFNSTIMYAIMRRIQDYIPYTFILYKLNENNQLVKQNVENTPKDRIEVPILVINDGLACQMFTEDDTKFGITESVKSKFVFSSYSALKPQNEIVLPTFLESYLKQQIPMYVESALTACKMFENRHYILSENDILPIDFVSSGVVEKNKKWGQGLQQFLEMKHGRKLSTLSVVTNFLSNMEFFRRYNLHNGSIFGLTGTVGTESDIQFLQTQYNLQVCKIPTHRRRKIVEDQLLQINGNQDDWIRTICATVEEKIQNRSKEAGGRAALIICEDILTAMKVTEKMKELVTTQVTTYIRSDSNVNLMDRKFQPGDVIVATTLAGRGTDICVSDEITHAGGIYVLVTFFPQNRRVELQAYGRTGRKGNPGSVQLVLHTASIQPEYQSKNLYSIREIRAEKEKNKLDSMLAVDVSEVNTRTELFHQYCATLREIHEQVKSRPDKDVIIDSLHETWGQWLHMNAYRKTSYNELSQKLSSDLIVAKYMVLDSKSPIGNFYHIIKYGNKLADHDPAGAICTYTQVIEGAERWSAVAYYNRAYCRIKESKKDYMKHAECDLVQAKALLTNYLEETTCVHQLVGVSLRKTMTEEEIHNCNFSKHVSKRQEVMSFLSRNIDEAIAKLKELSKENKDAEAYAKGVFSLGQPGQVNDFAMNMEILEIHGLGMEIVFSVKEKPRFCLDALWVFLLGILQVVVGVALMVLTTGILSNIGMGLISEGISDMIQGIEGMVKGEFSWEDWGIAKGISIAISIACAGIGKLIKYGKQAYKQLKSGVKEIKNQLKGIPKMVGGGFTEATKSNLKHVTRLVAKDVFFEVVNKGIEVVDKLIVDALLDKVARHIEANVRKYVQDEFDRRGPISELADHIVLFQLPPFAFKDKWIPSQLSFETMEVFKKIAEDAMYPEASAQKQMDNICKNLYKVKDGITETFNKNKTTKIVALVAEVFLSSAVVLTTVDEISILQTHYVERICTIGKKWCIEAKIPEVNSCEVDNRDLECMKIFRKELIDELVKSFKETVKEMLDSGVSGLIMRAKSKLINQAVKGICQKVLKRDKSLDLIRAGQKLNYPEPILKSPSGEADSALVDACRQSQAEDISSGTSSGSILEARIVAEICNKNIVISTVDTSGTETVLTRITDKNRNSEHDIQLMYTLPSDSNSQGHFNVITNGKVGEKNSSLYDAVAETNHRNDDVTSVHDRANALRLDVARKLTSPNEQWANYAEIGIQLNQFKTRSSSLNLQEFAVGGCGKGISEWNQQARATMTLVLRKKLHEGDRRNTF